METKNTFKIFTIFEYEKEQDYLRKMHQSGWKLVKVSGLGAYHFEKCVPEDVIYQLDYNPNGIAHKDEYVKMFNDCGWEYLQDYVGYSTSESPHQKQAEMKKYFATTNQDYRCWTVYSKAECFRWLFCSYAYWCLNLSTVWSPTPYFSPSCSACCLVYTLHFL